MFFKNIDFLEFPGISIFPAHVSWHSRKIKIIPEHQLIVISKNPKGQVARTSRLASTTLLVRAVLGHLEHFFPVLQLLIHMSRLSVMTAVWLCLGDPSFVACSHTVPLVDTSTEEESWDLRKYPPRMYILFATVNMWKECRTPKRNHQKRLILHMHHVYLSNLVLATFQPTPSIC